MRPCRGSPTGGRASSGQQASDRPLAENALLVVLDRGRADDVRLDRLEDLSTAADPVEIPLPDVATLLDLQDDGVGKRALAGDVLPQRHSWNGRAARERRPSPSSRLELLVALPLRAVQRPLPPRFLRLAVARDRADGARWGDLRPVRLRREA